jgi:hypothetical protein
MARSLLDHVIFNKGMGRIFVKIGVKLPKAQT